MKTWLIVVIFSFAAASASAQDRQTYALIVANNASVDDDIRPLRYADDDGARFYELFASTARNVTLLTTLDQESQRLFPKAAKVSRAPSKQNLEKAVADLRRQIMADKDAGLPVEVYVVFTGHGNIDANGEGYLSLSDGPLRRQDLFRDIIAPLQADFSHVIIDACHAYFMVNVRGGDWKDDRSGATLDQEFRQYLAHGEHAPTHPTVGVILSTAGAQEVHEWSSYGGGVFSHQLRSALVGAADADGDGQVTYSEVEAYLVAANASVQNPKARVHVHVRGPAQDTNRAVVNLDAMTTSPTLEISGGLGPIWLEDARGVRYADLNLAPDGAARVKLLPDGAPYWVRTDSFEVAIPNLPDVSLASLNRVDTGRSTRGAVDDAFRRELFKTPFGPGFVAGFRAAHHETQANVAIHQAPVWTWEWDVDYRLTTPILAIGTMQHVVSAAASVRGSDGAAMGAFAAYGTALGKDTLHRAALGAQVGWSTKFSRLHAGLVGRIGPQLVVVDTTNTQVDLISLHADAALTMSLPGEVWTPYTVAGTAFDVVTRAGVEQNEEDVWWSPYLGVGARF